MVFFALVANVWTLGWSLIVLAFEVAHAVWLLWLWFTADHEAVGCIVTKFGEGLCFLVSTGHHTK